MVRSTVCDVPRHVPWRDSQRRSTTGNRSVKAAAWFLAVALLIAATTWASSALDRHVAADDGRAEFIYLPPTRFLQAVSLGYEQALANLLWFRAINYFGRHYHSDRIYPWLATMCDAVTDLDPRAEHVYRFGGVILPWEADRIDEGIALLEKGVRNMPESWQLHYMLGFSYYFFRDDLDAASRSLRTATFLPGAPEFISHVAAIVDAAHRGAGRAVDFLTELEQHNVDDATRDVIRQRIRELALSHDIDALEAAAKAFTATAHRPPTTLDELVSAGILTGIPEEPFGGRYILDSTSLRVTSTSGRTPWRLGSSQLREAFLKARRAGN